MKSFREYVDENTNPSSYLANVIHPEGNTTRRNRFGRRERKTLGKIPRKIASFARLPKSTRNILGTNI
jgi:hypothetical protein